MTPTKIKTFDANSAYNLVYNGTKYTLQFYIDGDGEGAWFCTAFNDNGLFDLYEQDDNHNLCAFPTKKTFKSFIEKLANENRLRLIHQNEWDNINLV